MSGTAGGGLRRGRIRTPRAAAPGRARARSRAGAGRRSRSGRRCPPRSGQPHGQHVVAAGAGGQAPGDDRAGLGGQGEQAAAAPSSPRRRGPGRARPSPRSRRAASRSACALGGLAAAELGLDAPGWCAPAAGRRASGPCRAGTGVTEISTPGASHQVARLGDLLGVVVRAAEVPGGPEVERRRTSARSAASVVGRVEHPLGEVAELGGAVHAAALRLGDLAEQRDDGGDGGAGGGAQAPPARGRPSAASSANQARSAAQRRRQSSSRSSSAEERALVGLGGAGAAGVAAGRCPPTSATAAAEPAAGSGRARP